MVKNGTYKAVFASNLGLVGAGVVTVNESHVSGGDAGYWYEGLFQSVGGRIKANLTVIRHDSTATSIFGSAERFQLQVEGAPFGKGYRFVGSPSGRGNLSMTVELVPLTKAAA